MSADPCPPSVIDPLDPGAEPRVYSDRLVLVRSWRGPRPRRHLGAVRTEHFDVHREGHRVHLVHAIPDDRIDNDLAGLLSDELFQPGWLRGQDLFERLLTGIVVSSADDPTDAWAGFYRNTLARVSQALRGAGGRAAHGSIDGYAPVYRRVESHLAGGTALEVGSCFGFLSLRLAAAGRQVTASDVSPGTVDLLDAVARRLDVRLETSVADATRLPWGDRSFDNVLLIHLLEHLEPALGDRAVAEAVRVARRRVVVAVPFEDEPDETWGHVRTVTLDDLAGWGEASGHPYRVTEHHGGWLVVDTDG